MAWFFSKILLLQLLLVTISASGSTQLEKVAMGENRPDMSVVYKLMKNGKVEFPEGIPVDAEWANRNGYDTRINIQGWVELLLKHTPKLIAMFEKAYPGGTWVFIGRDGNAFADVLEAFYLEMGQRNRVARIGVSKASFKNISIEIIINLLDQIGYNLNSWQKKPPLLFVDPVSKGNGRQGRTLVAYIYNYLLENKDAKVQDLIKKINMIGLIVSTHEGRYYTITEPEQYYAAYKKNIDTGFYFDFHRIFENHIFMSVDESPDKANESGYTHFIGAWHDSYGPFHNNGKGIIKAQKGAVFPIEMRLSILWTQKKIWEAVRDPKFLKKVKKEAESLGYEFPYVPNDCLQALK